MLKKPIFYLRRSNFDKNGNIRNLFLKDKILIIFVHADFCIHCRNAKQDYQNAAIENKSSNVHFGAIQADGNTKGEQECEEILPKILKNYRGFPDYAIFVNCEPLLHEIKSRDTKTILSTLQQIEYNLKKNVWK